MMPGKSSLPLLAAILVVGCTESGGPNDLQSLIDAASREVTVANMELELDSIVQYDRLSGSPGEFAAVEYLRRTLEAEGIQVSVDTFQAYISDPVSASVEVPGTDFAPEAITVSGSGTVRNLSGRAVDLGALSALPPLLNETGELLTLDAHGPRGSATVQRIPDLAGRIALVTGQPRPGAATQVAEMGAAGVVFINPEERLNDLTVTSVWGTPSLLNYHRIPTLPVAEIKRSDGDRLRQILAGGPVQLTMSTETRTGWKELRLVTATIPGPEEDSPFVLAGGHLDSWYHGGTDNAGANVAMLEVARAFHRHRDQLRRGLVLAWWPGHSNGRYAGSTWFVDKHFDELRRRAVAHVNFEGLGQIEAKRFSANATASLTEMTQEMFIDEVGDTVRITPPGRNSDQSFNGVGLPLLQLNHSRLAEDGGYWWWHTPEDTRDKVSADVLKVDTDLYVAALARILTEPTLPFELSATVERLGSILRERQETAGEHFDLAEAIKRQAELLRVVRRLEGDIGTMSVGPELDLALVAILRPLHRVLFNLLGPYHPDPAVSEGELPGMNPIEMLASNAPTSDRYQFALTTLRRELPRILEALDVARERAEGLANRVDRN
jgi:Iap family predicted aminopeptidase